jgi:FkbM family methyltransferase
MRMIDEGWEPGVFEFLASVLREGDVFFDIGASIGPYSIFAAAKVGSAGRVVAIEPDPLASAFLAHNLELNGCDAVTVLREALHERDEPVGLRRRREWADSHTRTIRVADAPDDVVAGVTLTSVCRELGTTPTVLKIDIEGGERTLLSDENWAIVCVTRAGVVELHTEALGEACGPLQERLASLTADGHTELYEIDRRSARNYNVAWMRRA